jgi:hypothetical protein
LIKKWKKLKWKLKWEKELDLDVSDIWWKKQTILFFKITKDVELRWFHYRQQVEP